MNLNKVKATSAIWLICASVGETVTATVFISGRSADFIFFA